MLDAKFVVPMDVVKYLILPQAVAFGGLATASRVMLVSKSIREYAHNHIEFWMPYLEARKEVFLAQRLEHQNFMRVNRPEAETFHGFGWNAAKRHRVHHWEDFRQKFESFFRQHYELVPKEILREGGPIAVVQSKRILHRNSLHPDGRDDGIWATFVWKVGIVEGRFRAPKYRGLSPEYVIKFGAHPTVFAKRISTSSSSAYLLLDGYVQGCVHKAQTNDPKKAGRVAAITKYKLISK